MNISELDLILFLGNVVLGWLYFDERKQRGHCEEAMIQVLLETGMLEEDTGHEE